MNCMTLWVVFLYTKTGIHMRQWTFTLVLVVVGGFERTQNLSTIIINDDDDHHHQREHPWTCTARFILISWLKLSAIMGSMYKKLCADTCLLGNIYTWETNLNTFQLRLVWTTNNTTTNNNKWIGNNGIPNNNQPISNERHMWHIIEGEGVGEQTRQYLP